MNEDYPIWIPTVQLPRWACKAALEQEGLLADVETAVNAIGGVWKWRFSDAETWMRSDVLLMASVCGLSDSALDRVWELASYMAYGR